MTDPACYIACMNSISRSANRALALIFALELATTLRVR